MNHEDNDAIINEGIGAKRPHAETECARLETGALDVSVSEAAEGGFDESLAEGITPTGNTPRLGAVSGTSPTPWQPAAFSSGRISTLESLRVHLRWALELEHSTLPPYLCALYSLDPDRNPRQRK
ncbi:MAG TPA: ferritin-like domain-containing protein [Vicinamibacteria bacterium]|nr:ferritin-like domain-containing protein [Vicinamibacteria bacterium]